MTIKEGRINTYYTNGWFYGENWLEELDTEGEFTLLLTVTQANFTSGYAPSDFTSEYVGLSTAKLFSTLTVLEYVGLVRRGLK